MARELAEVAPGVLVATSRRYTTTSTVIVSGRSALLIDPAWEPDELVGLADALDHRGLRVTAGFSTHAHEDHVLWHPRFGDVPRWSSARTAELARTHRLDLVAALGTGWPPDLAALVGIVAPLAGRSLSDPFIGPGVHSTHPATRSDSAESFDHGSEVGPSASGDSAEPWELVIHDAHIPGHTAIWLPDRRILIAGDMLSDVELPLPLDPDDLPSYLAGLDALEPYAAQAELVIPGHGRPGTDPTGRLRADRDYLTTLLAGGDPTDERRTNPGMAEVHARLRRMCREPD